MRSFALLYTPAAARLFAKEDYDGIDDLYRRTAAAAGQKRLVLPVLLLGAGYFSVWTAFGALVFGFRVFWVNRLGQPDEYGLRGRVTELADLSAVA